MTRLRYVVQVESGPGSSSIHPGIVVERSSGPRVAQKPLVLRILTIYGKAVVYIRICALTGPRSFTPSPKSVPGAQWQER